MSYKCKLCNAILPVIILQLSYYYRTKDLLNVNK